MKLLPFILALTLLSLQPYLSKTACPQHYQISDKSCACNAATAAVDYSSLPSAPTSTRKIMLAFTIEYKSACSDVSHKELFTITTVVGGVTKKLVNFLVNDGVNTTEFGYQGIGETIGPVYPIAFYTGSATRIGLALDLDAKKANIYVLGTNYYSHNTATISDTTGLKLDSTTKFLFQPNNKLGIDYTNMWVLYDVADINDVGALFNFMSSAKTATVSADYDMTRFAAGELPGTLGQLSLGAANSPAQDPTGALEFTSTTQKVIFPSASMAPASGIGNLFKYSMTISFMLKITEDLTSDQTILTRYQNDGTTQVYRIGINAARQITVSVSGTALEKAQTSLTVNQWTFVSVNIISFDNGINSQVMNVISYDTTVVFPTSTYDRLQKTITSLRVEQANDKLEMSGFTGLISSFKITYGGQSFVLDGSCLSNCKLYQGPRSSACLLATCIGAQYPDGLLRCGSCQTAFNNIRNCVKCSDITTCTECSSPFVAVPAGDTCGCNPGKYVDSAANTCASCALAMENCDECSGVTTCTKCLNTFSISAVEPQCSCGIGTYLDSNQCKSCSASIGNCAECEGASTCTKCAPSYTLETNCKCQAGQYVDGATCKSCLTAIPKCSECSGASSCKTCSSNYVLSADKTSCSCPQGSYDTGSECKSCSLTVPHCGKCGGPSVCTQCSSNYVRNSDGTACSCLSGTFNSGASCDACSSAIPNCNTCSGPTTCTQCSTNFIKSDSGDKCDCNYGDYNAGTECKACSSAVDKCVECTSATDCRKCSSYFILLSGSKCGCAEYQYDSGTDCQNCADSIDHCYQCSGPGVCTQCYNGYEVSLGGAACRVKKTSGTTSGGTQTPGTGTNPGDSKSVTTETTESTVAEVPTLVWILAGSIVGCACVMTAVYFAAKHLRVKRSRVRKVRAEKVRFKRAADSSPMHGDISPVSP